MIFCQKLSSYDFLSEAIIVGSYHGMIFCQKLSLYDFLSEAIIV